MKFDTATARTAAEVVFEHPTAETNPYEVIEDYLTCGEDLGVDFDECVAAVRQGFKLKHEGKSFGEVLKELSHFS